MRDVGQWLGRLGLGKYERVFADNEIDADVLSEIQEDDLKELGISLGHRRKLLKALAELKAERASVIQAKISKSPREAERRQLTVMFCDLVGSTALSEMFDPEDLSVILQDYRNTCSQVIRRFEGFIARHLGDGILVYFGYPQAHEDDAERSVRAALGIVDAVRRLSPLPDLSLEVRIGIATGPVVVGDLVGEDTSEANAVVGRTPNIAARLQELAEPNSVVISDGTHRLVEGLFVADDLGEVRLKGMMDVVRVFRAVGVSSAPSRFEASIARGISPLVGRLPEIALLMNRWSLAKSEKGQVVLISGEPGVGKSRVVKAFRDQLVDESHEQILLFCLSYHQSTAFYPLIDHLERRLRFEEGDSPQQKLERLQALLTWLDISVTEQLPWLASLLAISAEGQEPEPVLSPEQLKQRIRETALTIVEVMARHHPLLIAIEDLHWADPSTLELIGELIDRIEATGTTLVCTFRPEFVVPWPRRPHMTTMTLDKLSRRDCRSLISNLTEGKTLPDEVLDAILAKADGVPLFAEELTKNLLEADVLQDSNSGSVASGRKTPLEIPSSLQDSLMARLDHRRSGKYVAQLAAVLGRSFSYDLIAAVWKRDRAELEQALSELELAGLVFKRGSAMQAEYEFKHALVQDAAYNSLLRATRRRFHRQILRVLEETFPNVTKTRPEVLAHHAVHGADPERVVQYAFAAGRKSFDRSANREAVNHLEKALEALRQLPQRKETIAKAIDVRLLLRDALIWLGEIERIGLVLRETEPLIESFGDAERTGQFKARLCNYDCLTGNQSEALEHGFHALRIAQDLCDESLEVDMAYRLGQPYYHLARYRDAINVLKRGVELIQPELELDRRGRAALPAVVGRAWIAICCAELGDFEPGMKYAQQAVELTTEAGHSLSTLFSHWGLGQIYLSKRNYAEALNALEEALAVCERSSLRCWYPRLASSVAMARVLSGSPGNAMALLEDARQVANSMGLTVDNPRLLERLAAVHLIDRQYETAEKEAREALELSKQANAPGYQAWALRRLGEIHATDDRFDGELAEKYLREALSLSEALSMRPLSALCREGIARVMQRRNRQQNIETAEQPATENWTGLESPSETATSS